MPVVSKCPKCHEAVTVPDMVAADAEVRCPLCEGVFPVCDALNELPPALEPLRPDLATTTTPPANVDTAPPVGAAVPLIDTRVASPVTPNTFTNIEVEHAPNGDAARPTVSGRLRGRKRGKSGLRVVTEWAFGAFLGAAGAYYILCWNGIDVPKFPLPFLPHTMHWLAAEVPDEETNPRREATGEMASDGKSAQTRRRDLRRSEPLIARPHLDGNGLLETVPDDATALEWDGMEPHDRWALDAAVQDYGDMIEDTIGDQDALVTDAPLIIQSDRAVAPAPVAAELTPSAMEKPMISTEVKTNGSEPAIQRPVIRKPVIRRPTAEEPLIKTSPGDTVESDSP